jgi:hypothetical protein
MIFQLILRRLGNFVDGFVIHNIRMYVKMERFQVGFMEILLDSKEKRKCFFLGKKKNFSSSRAEDLLANQSIGCFLIRLSESRFGFSLSFR